jgi:hypothetical protein
MSAKGFSEIQIWAQRAEECWQKAKECEDIAGSATNDVQRVYNELLCWWQKMAEIAEAAAHRLKA